MPTRSAITPNLPSTYPPHCPAWFGKRRLQARRHRRSLCRTIWRRSHDSEPAPSHAGAWTAYHFLGCQFFELSRRPLAKTAACGRVVHSTHRQVLARTDLDGSDSSLRPRTGTVEVIRDTGMNSHSEIDELMISPRCRAPMNHHADRCCTLTMPPRLVAQIQTPLAFSKKCMAALIESVRNTYHLPHSWEVLNGAGRGSRTPKTRRSADFESAASASSAIPALGRYFYCTAAVTNFEYRSGGQGVLHGGGNDG
jgi:hypothetical protein